MVTQHKIDRTRTREEGKSGLMLAAEYEQGDILRNEKLTADNILKTGEVIKSLLEEGANVDARDKKGKTALAYKADSGGLKIARILLRGAPYFAELDGLESGLSLLVQACEKGKSKLVEILLNAGCDTEIKNNGG